MQRRAFLAGMATLIVSGGAAAAAEKGAHGGLVAKVDGHAIEFVAKDLDIQFYFSEPDGAPMPTKGGRGRAVVQDAGKTHTVALSPVEPNVLAGKLPSPLGSKARVVMSMSGTDHPLQARFVTD